ncbi:MAG: 50S ribosomal protein L22 [candidate division WOR-3 bacterium]
MTGRCVLRYRRVSPKKARLLAELIKGKPVSEAKALLSVTPKRSARIFLKAISAAVSSCREKSGEKLDEGEMVISDVRVDQGPSWRILKPAIKPLRFGGYSTIRRRTSHITVEVRYEETEG